MEREETTGQSIVRKPRVVLSVAKRQEIINQLKIKKKNNKLSLEENKELRNQEDALKKKLAFDKMNQVEKDELNAKRRAWLERRDKEKPETRKVRLNRLKEYSKEKYNSTSQNSIPKNKASNCKKQVLQSNRVSATISVPDNSKKQLSSSSTNLVIEGYSIDTQPCKNFEDVRLDNKKDNCLIKQLFRVTNSVTLATSSQVLQNEGDKISLNYNQTNLYSKKGFANDRQKNIKSYELQKEPLDLSFNKLSSVITSSKNLIDVNKDNDVYTEPSASEPFPIPSQNINSWKSTHLTKFTKYFNSEEYGKSVEPVSKIVTNISNKFLVTQSDMNKITNSHQITLETCQNLMENNGSTFHNEFLDRQSSSQVYRAQYTNSKPINAYTEYCETAQVKSLNQLLNFDDDTLRINSVETPQQTTYNRNYQQLEDRAVQDQSKSKAQFS